MSVGAGLESRQCAIWAAVTVLVTSIGWYLLDGIMVDPDCIEVTLKTDPSLSVDLVLIEQSVDSVSAVNVEHHDISDAMEPSLWNVVRVCIDTSDVAETTLAIDVSVRVANAFTDR